MSVTRGQDRRCFQKLVSVLRGAWVVRAELWIREGLPGAELPTLSLQTLLANVLIGLMRTFHNHPSVTF